MAATGTLVTRSCPYLTGGDGSWRSAYAARGQRCAAVTPAIQLAVSKQRQLCTFDSHVGCATYLAARALVAPAGDDTDPGDAGLWPSSRPTLVALEGVRGGVVGGTSRRGGQALLVGLMIVAFLVLAIARTTPPAGSPSPSPESTNPALLPGSTASAAAASSSPIASPTPTAAPSVSASPSGGASTSPGPGASPTASPSRAPRSPTPAPSKATRYTVKSGDSLSGIAASFKVTVTALKRANGIGSSNLIHPGQVLVIP